jgi:UDP-N-acetylmuramate dehydrogenase
MFGTIGTFVSSLKVIDYDGRVRTLSRPEILFGYRDSNLSPYIILEATLRLSRRQRDILASRAADFLKLKASKQVLDAPSAGCIFKNPADGRFTAGQLIDMMGFKGVRAGGAEVSPKHANFIVNTGGATARDVLALVDSIKKKALETYGIALELEVKVL